MIYIDDLNVELGDFILNNIHLTIHENDFFVLMGPTGAGKTVLLEAIAGLVPIKKGSVKINERDVTHLPPEKHGVSIVYQDHSLFPHLTVEENISYGLHFKDINPEESQQTIDELVAQLDIKHLLKRKPGTLSGGELQRVSLARALAVKPEIVLLDEPLSALDPNFRQELRHMLKKIHQSSRTTFLMVTHDFSEAISLGTRGAIIHQGEIIQQGELEEIFNKPEGRFAADFVGMKNIFSAKFHSKKAIISEVTLTMKEISKKEKGFVAIRNEDIILSASHPSDGFENIFQGEIIAILSQGFFYEIDIMVKDIIFKSLVSKGTVIDLALIEGMEIFLAFKASAVHDFE